MAKQIFKQDIDDQIRAVSIAIAEAEFGGEPERAELLRLKARRAALREAWKLASWKPGF